MASTSWDLCSETLLSVAFNDLNLPSVRILAGENCLPRVASMLATGEKKGHVEMRIRIAHELAMHHKDYLDNVILARGTSKPRTKWATMYTTYSPYYNPGTKLSEDGVRNVFQKEVMDIAKPGEYCGIWQIHAMSSIIGVQVQWYCIFCANTFSNSHCGEKWIACQWKCIGWAHRACTDGKSIFVCPYCTD